VQQIQTEPSRLPALDLLRLAAVAGVILYHYGFWGPYSHGTYLVALPELAPIAQYGFLGVPVFFAISGFVIAFSAEGRTPMGFAIARFSRIYPTFVVCMTITFVAVALFGSGHFEVTARKWLYNLFIAAPMLGQPYMDSAYWSLVIEVVFYIWVVILMASGLFPRRIDAIIVVWLAITFANELTIDAPIFEKLFIADDSGFFAVGLLIYEHFRGRRDVRFWALSALALGTAVFQAVHRLERLGVHNGGSFDPKVVIAACLISLALVFLATKVKSMPLPAKAVLAVGGITYPLYLLHMQIGYVVLEAISPQQQSAAITPGIVAGVFALAAVVWRFFDSPLHRWTKENLSALASRSGLQVNARSRSISPDCLR
jgi:peptidoglycan/LPS O-acetylase OafA/YrhL